MFIGLEQEVQELHEDSNKHKETSKEKLEYDHLLEKPRNKTVRK